MSRPNTNNYNVKGNVREVRKNPKFETTTSDVAAFIQNDLNKITKAMRTQGIKIDDVKIHLTTQPLSKYFCMAVLIMPTSVLASSAKLDNVPSVFKGANEDSGVVIKKSIWGLIKNYVYTPRDREMFGNPAWRQQVKFKSSQQINALNGFIRPTIINNNGKYVCIAIDLVKVFKEMLKNPDPDVHENFNVWIEDFEEIEGGMHKFTISKTYFENGKGNGHIEEAVRRNIEKVIAPVYRSHK